MQASVYGKRGILPVLSRALRLESGILGKYGLSFADDFTVVFDDFLLAVFVSRNFYKIDFSKGVNKNQPRTAKFDCAAKTSVRKNRTNLN